MLIVSQPDGKDAPQGEGDMSIYDFKEEGGECPQLSFLQYNAFRFVILFPLIGIGSLGIPRQFQCNISTCKCFYDSSAKQVKQNECKLV